MWCNVGAGAGGWLQPRAGEAPVPLPLSCSPFWTFLERAEGRKRGSQVSPGKAWEGEASRFYSSLLVIAEGDSESAVLCTVPGLLRSV